MKYYVICATLFLIFALSACGDDDTVCAVGAGCGGQATDRPACGLHADCPVGYSCSSDRVCVVDLKAFDCYDLLDCDDGYKCWEFPGSEGNDGKCLPSAEAVD